MEQTYGSNSKAIFAGMLIGAIAGWLVGELLADHFAPEYYTEEELVKLEDLISLYGDPSAKEPQGVMKKVEIKAHKHDSEEETMPKKDYRAIFSGDEKPDMSKLVEKYNNPDYEEPEEDVPEPENEGERDEETADDLESIFNNRDVNDIYIMLPEEWQTNESGFKQVTLHYYTEDDVLTDDKDAPLANPSKIIGEDALLSFGLYDEDADVIYVCNPKLGGEYEIIREEASYTEAVLGVVSPIVHHNVFTDQELDED